MLKNEFRIFLLLAIFFNFIQLPLFYIYYYYFYFQLGVSVLIGYQILVRKYFPQRYARQASEPGVELRGVGEEVPQIVIHMPTPQPQKKKPSSQDRCRPRDASQPEHHPDDQEPLVIDDSTDEDEDLVGEALFERLLKKHQREFLNIPRRRQRQRSL